MKLRNIAALSKVEFKRIAKNPLALGLFFALLILPSLYAWFNIKALWDPYSNTGNLPIAVYSDDKPVIFHDKEINVGENLIAELHDNHSLGWRFVSTKAELDKGVKSGKYYAGIYLPEEFSKDLMSFTKGNIKKPEIEYSVNEKINAIAPKITEKGASTLQETISQEFTKETADTLMSVFNQIGFDLEINLPHIKQLESAILDADENMSQYDGYMDKILELNGKMPEFQAKLNKANEFSSYLPQADDLSKKVLDLNGKLPKIQQDAALILQVQQKLPEINQAANQLKMLNQDMPAIQQSLEKGIATATNALSLVNDAQEQLPKIQQVMEDGKNVLPLVQSGVIQLHDWLNPTIATDIELVQTIVQAINGNLQTLLMQIENGTINKEQVSTQLANLNTQLTQANNILAGMKELLLDLHADNLQNLIDTITDVQAKISNLQAITTQVQNSLSTMSDEDFKDKANQLSNLSNTLVEQINYLASKENLANIDQMLSKAEKDLNYAGQLLDKAEQKDFTKLLSDADGTLTTSVSLLEKYQKEMPAIAQEVSDANELLNGHLDEITKGINLGVDLYQNQLPLASQKLAQAADFITNDWPSLRKELSNSLAMANQKLPEITQSVATASNLVEEYWPSMQDGIHKAAEAIRKGEETTSLDDIIKLLKLDANQESNFLSSPVNLKTTNYYPVANYGSASTPFYTALCLWVGAVLFSSVAGIKYHLDKEQQGKYSKREMYVTRMITFLIVGLAQALIVGLGNIFLLGTYVANPLLEILFALVVSLSFMSLVYFLVGMFGNLGKGAAIIILVLSISGGGGNFPIVLSGKFFQTIHPFLPFTHAVNLLREATGGVYWANAAKYLAILLGIFVLVTILGIVFAPKMQERMRIVNEKVARAHLFH